MEKKSVNEGLGGLWHRLEGSGWTLRDETNHVFTFPNHVMEPGQVCRAYSNQHHPEWCDFSYGSDSAIWNNGGDSAELRDGCGDTVHAYCY